MRELRVIAVDDVAEVPASLALPAKHFIVLLAIATPGVPDADITRRAESLASQGAVAFVCAGPDAARIETLVDHVVMTHYDVYADDGGATCIWTTSHQAREFADAIAFLSFAGPASAYEASCEVALAIIVGNDAWAAEIATVMTD